jgi:hypothetical protein
VLTGQPVPGAPGGGHATRSSVSSISAATTPDAATPGRGGFSDTDPLYKHSWEPAPGQKGADTYADLASARADAEERKRQREAALLSSTVRPSSSAVSATSSASRRWLRSSRAASARPRRRPNAAARPSSTERTSPSDQVQL